MIRIFLDGEWADNLDSELVSMALVSEDEQHRYYSEVGPLPKEPTDWVRAVFYPLMEHGYAARQKAVFTGDLREFLSRFKAPLVLYDYKVEHPFRVVKRQFVYAKVRYRGLAKNMAQMLTLFALSNLWMARRQLLPQAGGVSAGRNMPFCGTKLGLKVTRSRAFSLWVGSSAGISASELIAQSFPRRLTRPHLGDETRDAATYAPLYL